MPQGHFTADEWMRYVGENMPDATARGLEGFRNDNNIFVDGLPPPQYSGPLSSGGSAGARPQATGVSTVDPEDETDMPPAGALPYKSVGDWAQGMQGLSGEQAAYGRQRESERAAQYEAARKALEERRFGPSEAERWYALSAAIGTPMVRPSFGGVMRNVSSAMGDFSKARREAEVSRADALAALQQSYLSGNDAAKIAEFRQRREAMAPVGSVLAAQARASVPKYAVVGEQFQQVPGTGHNLGVLTPDQLLLAKSDPRNKGKSFYTADGRQGVIN
jgi:hypothetical protein